MKQVSKKLATIKQAEQQQNRLYNRYSTVKLVKFPMNGESGTYTWKVE